MVNLMIGIIDIAVGVYFLNKSYSGCVLCILIGILNIIL